jgi:hypothetical protein
VEIIRGEKGEAKKEKYKVTTESAVCEEYVKLME